MTQCSATSVPNHTVIESSWILFRFAYRGRPGTEGDQGHRPRCLVAAAELQMGRGQRWRAAAGSCQPQQSAADGSASSVGTGTKTWGTGVERVPRVFHCHHKNPPQKNAVFFLRSLLVRTAVLDPTQLQSYNFRTCSELFIGSWMHGA